MNHLPPGVVVLVEDSSCLDVLDVAVVLDVVLVVVSMKG